MLPFLKKHQVAGLIIQNRKPDKPKEDNNHDQAVMSAAEDLMNAIHSRDTKAVADALRAAFEILDSLPHEEGPHENEEEDINE